MFPISCTAADSSIYDNIWNNSLKSKLYLTIIMLILVIKFATTKYKSKSTN